jgi:hypothetical protein
MENGKGSAARAEMQTLGKEAGAKGFRLIARKAATASAAKNKSAARFLAEANGVVRA